MPLIPQKPSSYSIEQTCQIENLGWLLEQLPKPFGIFDPSYKGTFVEVGAFDGVTYSNVIQFARAGWSGIMIEPMPTNLGLIAENLSKLPGNKVIVEPVACSDRPGLIPMFFEREGSREAKPGELTHQIQAMRLNDILDKDGWKTDFDLLVIDTEDHEQQVLKGFNLSSWIPKLVICETHGHHRAILHKIFEPLYRIFSEDGLNTLFVRRDWYNGPLLPTDFMQDMRGKPLSWPE